MAGKRSVKADLKLDNDVTRVLALVKKKGSAQSQDIQKALRSTVRTYRYRTVLEAALKKGLKVTGKGPAAVYTVKG